MSEWRRWDRQADHPAAGCDPDALNPAASHATRRRPGALELDVSTEGTRWFAQAKGQTEFERLSDDLGDFYLSTFEALATPTIVGG
jgi:hypothetical protein